MLNRKLLAVFIVCVGSCFQFGLGADPNRFDGDPILKDFLQPNHITNGDYDFLTTQDAEARGICTRPCDGAKPMICYYHFTLENYATVGPACGNCTNGSPNDCNNKHCVTADGFERAVLTINRQIPGPSIQVCLFDTIVVDVHNKMLGKTVTLHWHGLYQRFTPFMDGVQFVTQCPILHNTKFRYKFPGVPDGSFFYHSHIGLQKMEGIEGSLIIREPKSVDKTTHLWDYDLPSHAVIVTDWHHDMTDQKYPGFLHTNTGNFPESYLINGKNNYVYPNGTSLNAPYAQFNVKRGSRYRFRLIGGSCLSCPYLLTVEKHKMLLIATDGTYCEPEEYDTITMLAGDRMDVVINAKEGNAGDSFWIQVKAACSNFNNTNIHGEAILHYVNDQGPKYQAVPMGQRPNSDTYGRGKSLNAGDVGDCSDPNSDLVCMSHVNALEPPVNPIVLKDQADFRLPLKINFHLFNEDSLFWNDRDQYHHWELPAPGILASAVINNRSFEFTPFPLLTQIAPIPAHLRCPDKCSNEANSTDLCECTHILKYPLGSVGEIIFIDFTPNGNFYHPMHLHGNDMYIIEQGKIPANYAQDIPRFVDELSARMDSEGPKLTSTRGKPVVKDTIGNIPAGYTVVRVHFNNPGFWFLHCHFIFHTDVGMGLILQIGEKYQMRGPPAFFPRCNNFLPPVYPHEFDEFIRSEYTKRTLELDNQ
uniref:Laccase-5 n=1 Tax=Cacopsylla melanoneura TaxID=428564 RepID=A0A8D8ZWC7_9HEMI